MTDKLQDQLAELAQKLGTTGEHLWQVCVRQAPISSTIYFFWMALTVALVIGFAWKAKRSKEWWIVVWGCASLLMVITGLIELSDLNQALAGYFNPEYAALKDILDAIKN